MNINKTITRLSKIELENGDYIDQEGFVVCGNCHTRRQCEVVWQGIGKRKMPIMCKCREELFATEEEDRKRQSFQIQMDHFRQDGITDPKYLQYCFSNDDNQNPKVTAVCERYVQEWQQMKASNMGILFTGTIGTGKSFLACSIANALIEELVPVCVTNFPRILSSLQGLGGNHQAFIDKLQKYHLLVIDDLGTERDTSYSAELIFNVIDTRVRSNLPTIITTNLTLRDMETTTDMQYKRIYDRVLEMCPIRLVMEGESRRNKNANQKRERALELLWDGDKRG